jgi:hypothetical protein
MHQCHLPTRTLAPPSAAQLPGSQQQREGSVTASGSFAPTFASLLHRTRQAAANGKPLLARQRLASADGATYDDEHERDAADRFEVRAAG